MKKFLRVLLVVLVLLIVGIISAKNFIAKAAIEKGVNKLVGQKLTIGSIDIGLLSTQVDIKDLKVYNPQGYSEELLAYVKAVFIKFNLRDIINGFLHFPEIRLTLDRIDIEKDKDGILNIEHFKPEKKEKELKVERKEGKKEFLINKLTIQIGSIHYIDKTKTPPFEKELKLDFSKTFTDVDSPKVIIDAIISESTGQLLAQGINVVVERLKEGNIGLPLGGKELQLPTGKDKGQVVEKLFRGLAGEKGEMNIPQEEEKASASSKEGQGPSMDKIFGGLLGGKKK